MPPDYRWLTYDTVDAGSIVIIGLNRPDQRNAQHRSLLVELDDAFLTAEADDAVRVVILRGEGPTFSAGHDVGSADRTREREPGPDQHATFRDHGATTVGVERTWRQEWHYFFQNTRRWRDLRKITIAEVHGHVYSAGLMLMWCCDLIVADPTAVFADVVGARFGMCGVEYFAHPWELGARKAKELLLTGDSIDADEAYRLGMVAKVFPAGERQASTLAFARRIAQLPTIAALTIKEAVNQTQDNQGFTNALQAAFTLHQANHAHWNVLSGGAALMYTPELGAPSWKERGPIRPASKSAP